VQLIHVIHEYSISDCVSIFNHSLFSRRFFCGGHFVKMAFSKISGKISGPIPTKPTLCTNARVSYTETKTRRQNISTICRRFKRCSKLVKVRLFRSFCVFYDTALWCNYSVGAINRLALWYRKCLKYFLDILSTVVLKICCLSWDSQASTLWYTTIMSVLLTGCQRVTMFLFNVFYSITCKVHCALHVIFLFCFL